MAGLINQNLYNSPQTPAGTPAPKQIFPAPTPATPVAAKPQTSASVSSKDITKIMRDSQSAIPGMAPAATVTAQTPTAVTSSVDRGQTTAGLIESMLSKDSDYITRAKAIAMERMGERGLQSSSLAQGAGVGAAIDAAGNVAAQDAGIYSQQRLANQSAQNDMANANANRVLSGDTFNASAQNDQTAAQFDASNQLGRSIVASRLAKDQAAFTSGLNKEELSFSNDLDLIKMAAGQGYDLEKLAAQNGFTLTQMAAQLGIDKDKMSFGSKLNLAEMDYGGKMDLMKMAAANGYDIDKMAKQQGYTIEQMSAALGFDMTKMAKGQEMDLQKLAVANDYDVGKMAIDLDSRLKLQAAAAKLDEVSRKDLMTFEASLSNSATGRAALTNMAGRYAELFDVTRRDPNLSAEDKARALDDLRADFKSNAAVTAGLYGLDASGYLSQINVSAPAPAPAPAPTPAPAPSTSPSGGYVSGGDASP